MFLVFATTITYVESSTSPVAFEFPNWLSTIFWNPVLSTSFPCAFSIFSSCDTRPAFSFSSASSLSCLALFACVSIPFWPVNVIYLFLQVLVILWLLLLGLSTLYQHFLLFFSFYFPPLFSFVFLLTIRYQMNISIKNNVVYT